MRVGSSFSWGVEYILRMARVSQDPMKPLPMRLLKERLVFSERDNLKGLLDLTLKRLEV